MPAGRGERLAIVHLSAGALPTQVEPSRHERVDRYWLYLEQARLQGSRWFSSRVSATGDGGSRWDGEAGFKAVQLRHGVAWMWNVSSWRGLWLGSSLPRHGAGANPQASAVGAGVGCELLAGQGALVGRGELALVVLQRGS